MMLISQSSSPGIRATHGAVLATAEVLGKLSMISMSGILVDNVGYQCVFFWILHCFGIASDLCFAAGPYFSKEKVLVTTSFRILSHYLQATMESTKKGTV